MAYTEFMEHFIWNNLAAHRPPWKMIPHWPWLGAVILEMKDVTGNEKMCLENPDQADYWSMQTPVVYGVIYIHE